MALTRKRSSVAAVRSGVRQQIHEVDERQFCAATCDTHTHTHAYEMDRQTYRWTDIEIDRQIVEKLD